MSTPTTSGHPIPGAGPLPAPRLAMGVVVAVFVSICLIDFLHVLLLPNVTVGAVVLSSTCIVALTLVQSLWYSGESTRLRSSLGHAVLGFQACLAYLPILVFGQAWVGVPGFLAGSALLVLRPVFAWTAFGLVVASMGYAQWVFTERLVDTLYTAISTVTTGLVVYGLSRLTTLVREVQESRAEIARMAVLRERLRFARDLHDLLGYSLSAITLKIELTHRLLETSPRKAGDQLLEILDISRLALSDARTVASGYRELSIEEECRSAVSVLSAADVAVELDVDHTDLPVQVSTVLATVLREGVTNLLRHSKAKHCEITIRQERDHASIEIVNDDLAALPANRDGGGCGLRNLSVRAKEIGGSVTVTRDPHMFRLRADVPLRVMRNRVPASEPACFPCDPDRVDPVACGQLPDDRGEVVTDGAD
ncbi:sensor histidine kinase [Actinophytocola sp.]|uniref:sensor histidine kinase n=1 Tax=Actinophytocola sp. TaxID=1872138 RepID=UPI002ED17089